LHENEEDEAKNKNVKRGRKIRKIEEEEKNMECI
jgi:hypothetical protein